MFSFNPVDVDDMKFCCVYYLIAFSCLLHISVRMCWVTWKLNECFRFAVTTTLTSGVYDAPSAMRWFKDQRLQLILNARYCIACVCGIHPNGAAAERQGHPRPFPRLLTCRSEGRVVLCAPRRRVTTHHQSRQR